MHVDANTCNDRLCCYIVSGHPSFVQMTTTSIEMIRRYNREVPIRVFFVAYAVYPRPEHEFDAFCSRNAVEMLRRPPLDKGDYFQENKAWLGDCTESMILLLDSDTFIFGDVERVFDKYDQYDVSACRPSAILRSDLAPGGHRYVIGIPAQASAWTRFTPPRSNSARLMETSRAGCSKDRGCFKDSVRRCRPASFSGIGCPVTGCSARSRLPSGAPRTCSRSRWS